jgi:hypothetical protein
MRSMVEGSCIRDNPLSLEIYPDLSPHPHIVSRARKVYNPGPTSSILLLSTRRLHQALWDALKLTPPIPRLPAPSRFVDVTGALRRWNATVCTVVFLLPTTTSRNRPRLGSLPTVVSRVSLLCVSSTWPSASASAKRPGTNFERYVIGWIWFVPQ